MNVHHIGYVVKDVMAAAGIFAAWAIGGAARSRMMSLVVWIFVSCKMVHIVSNLSRHGMKLLCVGIF